MNVQAVLQLQKQVNAGYIYIYAYLDENFMIEIKETWL